LPVSASDFRWAGCSLDDINPIGSYSSISQSI
jgi:hypothetical protein